MEVLIFFSHVLHDCLVLTCYENRFWWSLLVGVDWWDAVGCTQSAAEDGIGKAALLVKAFCYFFLFKFVPEKRYSLLFHICTLLASDPFFLPGFSFT